MKTGLLDLEHFAYWQLNFKLREIRHVCDTAVNGLPLYLVTSQNSSLYFSVISDLLAVEFKRK